MDKWGLIHVFDRLGISDKCTLAALGPHVSAIERAYRSVILGLDPRMTEKEEL